MPPQTAQLSKIGFPLRTRRLVIEPPAPAWLDEIATLIDDVEVSRWLLHVPHPYRRKDQVRFLKTARKGLRDGTNLSLTVRERASGRVVGGVGLHQISWDHRRAELGYWIARRSWRRGFGREAAERMLRLAFGDLHLHRVTAHVYRTNRRSAALLRRLGFREEGVFRESILHWGVWEDERCFAILGTEFRRGRRRPARR